MHITVFFLFVCFFLFWFFCAACRTCRNSLGRGSLRSTTLTSFPGYVVWEFWNQQCIRCGIEASVTTHSQFGLPIHVATHVYIWAKLCIWIHEGGEFDTLLLSVSLDLTNWQIMQTLICIICQDLSYYFHCTGHPSQFQPISLPDPSQTFRQHNEQKIMWLNSLEGRNNA